MLTGVLTMVLAGAAGVVAVVVWEVVSVVVVSELDELLLELQEKRIKVEAAHSRESERWFMFV